MKTFEKIQEYFTKRLHIRTNRKNPIPDYADRLKGFGLSTLEASCVRNDLMILYYIISGNIQEPFTLSFSTRKPSRILIESKATRTFHNAFFIVPLLFGTSLSHLMIFRWMTTIHFPNFLILTYLVLPWQRLKGFKAVLAYSWIIIIIIIIIVSLS